jgi:hypothetical protein
MILRARASERLYESERETKLWILKNKIARREIRLKFLSASLSESVSAAFLNFFITLTQNSYQRSACTRL